MLGATKKVKLNILTNVSGVLKPRRFALKSLILHDYISPRHSCSKVTDMQISENLGAVDLHAGLHDM